MFRSIGAERGYFFGFTGNDTVSLIKRDHETVFLKSVPFKWKTGKVYTLSAGVSDGSIVCSVDNEEVISFVDNEYFPYGMAGTAKLGSGETVFYSLKIQESGADV